MKFKKSKINDFMIFAFMMEKFTDQEYWEERKNDTM